MTRPSPSQDETEFYCAHGNIAFVWGSSKLPNALWQCSWFNSGRAEKLNTLTKSSKIAAAMPFSDNPSKRTRRRSHLNADGGYSTGLTAAQTLK